MPASPPLADSFASTRFASSAASAERIEHIYSYAGRTKKKSASKRPASAGVSTVTTSKAANPVGQTVGRSDEEELLDLAEMFHDPSSFRQEWIPMGKFMKIKVAERAWQKADEVRRERRAIDEMRQRRAEELRQHIDDLRAWRGEKDQEAVAADHERKVANVRAMQQEERDNLQRREQYRQAGLAVARERVAIARALDAKLDAQEAQQDALEQAESRQLREALLGRLAAQQQKEALRKSHLASQARQAHQDASASKASALARKQQNFAHMKAERDGLNKAREEAEAAERERNRQMHEARTAARRRAKEERDSQLKELQARAGGRSKALAQAAHEALQDEMKANRATRSARLRQEYVPVRRVDEEMGEAQVALRQLYSLGPNRDAALREENEKLWQRLSSVSAATDNDVRDEVLGVARQQAAAESRARREAEAERIRLENAALKGRLRGVRAVTDNDVSDDAAGEARLAAAAASKARKRASHAKIAVENAALRERLRNSKAATNNDLSGDATGAARIATAAASKAKKRETTERLARENAAMRERIHCTAARTDDDIGDEAAGDARRAAANASRERKQLEMETLKKETAKMEARIANTKAATDNDITDDPAGATRQPAKWKLWGW